MKTLATWNFTADLYWHGSWGSRDVGTYPSTMALMQSDDRYWIEWDIPDLDTQEEIGLELEGTEVAGYDGIMALPSHATALLRAAGFTVGEDVTCGDEPSAEVQAAANAAVQSPALPRDYLLPPI
jgi:hypothetical protein